MGPKFGGRCGAMLVGALCAAGLLGGCGPVADDPAGARTPDGARARTVTELTAIATSIRGADGPLEAVPAANGQPGSQGEQLRSLAKQLQTEPADCADQLTAGLDVDPAVLRAIPTVTVRQADGALSLTLMDGSNDSARALGDRAVGGTVFAERDEVERALADCGEVTLDPGSGSRITLTRTLIDVDVVGADRAYAVSSELVLLGMVRRQVTVSAERGGLIAISSAAEPVEAQRIAAEALRRGGR